MEREETLTVRVDLELKKKLEALEKEKMQTKSDIVRQAIIKYIEREKELNEMKKIIAQKFAGKDISFEEAVRILGYEEARKIAFYVEIAKKSFEEGIK